MNKSTQNPKHLSPLLRWSLLLAGLVAVVLGVVGIFLPVLPTVPFLLLALACFARSSGRFYAWLIGHAHLGPMVRPYVDGRGMQRSSKVKAITLVWTSIAFSVIFLVVIPWVQAMLLVIALCVTLYLLRLPTAEVETRGDNG